MKGDEIIIPILIMNRSKSIWGEDAMEFKCAIFGSYLEASC